MKFNFKNVIPVFRGLIHNCGIDYSQILNANSYFRTDASLMNKNGTVLSGIQREDCFVVFDLSLVDFKSMETVDNQTKVLIEGKITFDLYGEDSYETSMKIYAKMLQSDQILEFIENGIGIHPQIDLTNSYETIHGVQWLRSNIGITFTYEYIVENENTSTITSINEIIMKGYINE